MSAPAENSAPVAVVTGAARGIGRGIALVLGEAGATVYVTDRESRGHRHSDLPGTVEDTAEQVTARGGRGIAVPLDHRDDAAVAALFDRVRAEHGGLDLLVANACNGNALPFTPGVPFWELPLDHWPNLMEVGVRSHLVSAWHAAPLLVERRGLLVVTGYADERSEVVGHVFFDLAMNGVTRLARTLAHDLRPHGVTVLGLAPGFTATEAIVAALGANPPGADSQEFPGRALRALLEDPEVARHSGRMLPVAEVAAEYGLTDVPATPAAGGA
ncbi:SDR family NAD(P)-dependent oxidoreductase [Actinomadura viridis]|uniref:NAD(P)-dependent dehydrogenase (Short-subunit alcohol dehydrogenase family) n=1 Tax=Actinomadura viridis TaxID=58110 RepID=A0A931DFK5_9ACTN|nr:SDR family NAD(P)-dependent oxidoreductase [Actinomadura viridis]MBG6086641.1 NAD(P)-dependent dehydrogenase (short-subunit alcohol dehydrogenase family) [Actinomadura viridis]